MVGEQARRFDRSFKLAVLQTDRPEADAKAPIGICLDEVHKRQRLHSALDELTPAVFEAIMPSPGAAAQQPRVMTGTDCP